jgi:hypothetical protein
MTTTEQQTLPPSPQPAEIAAGIAKDAQENLAGLEVVWRVVSRSEPSLEFAAIAGTPRIENGGSFAVDFRMGGRTGTTLTSGLTGHNQSKKRLKTSPVLEVPNTNSEIGTTLSRARTRGMTWGKSHRGCGSRRRSRRLVRFDAYSAHWWPLTSDGP